MQRTAISSVTGIRKNSVTSIVAELLEAGLLCEEQPGETRSALALDGERYRIGAASVGQGRIVFAAISLDGSFERHFSIDFDPGKAMAQLPGVLGLGLTCLREATGARLLNCSISVPGLVNAEHGTCLRAVHIGIHSPLDLRSYLSGKLGCDVLVENDVRCQLWACVWYGRLGRGVENLFYIGLHEGLACAIVTRGQLTVGERFAAGEIGHTRVGGGSGRRCPCGKQDCLECYCSANAILEAVRSETQVCPESFSDLEAVLGRSDVMDVLASASSLLVRSVAATIVAIDPHAVLLGTPSRAVSEAMVPYMQNSLDSELSGLTVEGTPILAADDVSTGSLKGAAGLAVRQAFRHYDFATRD